MISNSKVSAFILGLFVCAGLTALGALLAKAALDYKKLDRTITVKGLSEREYSADIVIWPIQFTQANSDLEKLYESIEQTSAQINEFLAAKGIQPGDISVAPVSITDKLAQGYGKQQPANYRYTARQTVTVYSFNIELVRNVMGLLPELGKSGIVFTGDDYSSKTEYIFNRLNEVKPTMIEEATKKAREVAQKFAKDSKSILGKIKRASQGQFSITTRDRNNPHIKRIRVVSTITYYLTD